LQVISFLFNLFSDLVAALDTIVIFDDGIRFTLLSLTITILVTNIILDFALQFFSPMRRFNSYISRVEYHKRKRKG
jgi:hypothetical protein